jgi:hypothetical protein
MLKNKSSLSIESQILANMENLYIKDYFLKQYRSTLTLSKKINFEVAGKQL